MKRVNPIPGLGHRRRLTPHFLVLSKYSSRMSSSVRDGLSVAAMYWLCWIPVYCSGRSRDGAASVLASSNSDSCLKRRRNASSASGAGIVDVISIPRNAGGNLPHSLRASLQRYSPIPTASTCAAAWSAWQIRCGSIPVCPWLDCGSGDIGPDRLPESGWSHPRVRRRDLGGSCGTSGAGRTDLSCPAWREALRHSPRSPWPVP